MITSPSNRIYVGSTRNIKTRWQMYFNLNCKTQYKLYNSLKKYGPENHKFEVIMECPLEEMFKYETLIGWGFDVLEPKNLNLSLPKLGDVWTCMSDVTIHKLSLLNKGEKNKFYGKKHSEISKQKMSKSSIGRTHSLETRIKISKKASLKGDKIKKQKVFEDNPKFKLSVEARIKMSNSKKGKVFSKEFIDRVAKINKIPIIQMDLDGNFIKEWESAKDAGEAINISNSGITACCKNKPKYKTAGGFKWEYKDQNQTIN